MTSPGEVVWVTPEMDWRGRSGGAIRTLRLLEAVSARLPVHFIVAGGPVLGSPPRDLNLASVHAFSGLRGIRARGKALRAGWPTYMSRTWNPLADKRTATLAMRGVVVLDHFATAPYRPRSLPYVLHLHNVESDRLGSATGAGWRRAETWWNGAMTRRVESNLRKDPSCLAVTVSNRDRDLFGSGVVVPNGTDLPGDVPPRPAAGSVLFVGALDYPPNVEAVRWWVSEIAPRLPTWVPALTVVGRGVPAAPLPGVNLVGEVPDVRPFLEQASVVVAPLLRGGGSRLKILEAMAYRRPVVATSKGAEGLPVRSGRDILIADSAEDFATGVLRVRQNPELAASLVTSATEVARAHDWSVVAGEFANRVTALVSSLR